jgi:hypothetical protein
MWGGGIRRAKESEIDVDRENQICYTRHSEVGKKRSRQMQRWLA